ncbi:MAG: arginine--tRNA ligase [Candidatus Methanoplasma sp.]|jgi:arginyl-tRNA synthetase|nr:arginine--tRNA ligase [Candidatus Methanoplasma sp.]
MESRQRFECEVDSAVRAALKKIGSPDLKFIKEVSDMADLAVPCFSFSKELRSDPKAIAERLAANIAPSGLISSVSALNGYLNFMMDDTALIGETLKRIIAEGDAYGSMPENGIKINVEHTSTNPTGPIHVGRARNPIIGDTLARSLKRCGYDVQTEYYVNDVGKQVVILTWGVNNVPKGSVTEEDRDKTDHRLVAYYREANKRMEEDSEVKEHIAEMLRRFEDGDEEVIRSVRKTAEAMLEGLKETLADINVELDNYTWESDFIMDGSAKDVVDRLKGSKYAGQTEDGAWYVDLKDFGVQGKNTKFTFTRSDGTTLYTTRDLAYHLDKFKRADRAVDVLGEDQKLGSKQLCSALEILGSKKVPEAMFYSFVSLPEGKMSTRKGVVVYLDDLIDEAVSRAVNEIRSRRSDLSEEEMLNIARKIGIGAIRYNIVRVHPEKQFVFKWDEALNFDGNSGPYIQYVHARACSMLSKAGKYDCCTDPGMFTDEYERALIKSLSKFGRVIKEAGEERRVHVLPAYGHEVAVAFNQFYAMVPVLASDENRNSRLTLVECTRTVLRNVLDCLGIDCPEEM